MNNENLDERIKDILEDVKEGGLTKDSIAMIICLENVIDLAHGIYVEAIYDNVEATTVCSCPICKCNDP